MRKFLALLLTIICLSAYVHRLNADPLAFYSFPFIGKWNPSENPLLLDDYGLQDIQNLRKDGKHFKGVSGHTVVNASSQLNTYPAIINGFHFFKDQPAESHVIVYAADTAYSPTAGGLYQNTTAIPSQGNFSATLLTTAIGSDVWRFSPAPAGNMVAANGDYTYIWGGNELEATSFVTSSASILYTLTDANDYSSILSNTRQTSDQVATLSKSGGIDSSTQLLLHFDGANGSSVVIDSAATAYPCTATGTLDTTTFKFGTASINTNGGGSIVVGTSTSFNFLHAVGTTGQWTVDGWFQAGNFAAVKTILDTGLGGVTGSPGVLVNLQVDRTIIVYILNATGAQYVLQYQTTGTYPNDTNFHHIEVSYDQTPATGNCKVYVDGVVLDAAGGNKTANAATTNNQTNPLRIGLDNNSAFNWQGRIDEFRISNVLRHTANFSPPSRQYGNASNRFLIGTKRPLQGVKFSVQSGNTIASNLLVQEWQGNSGWTALSVTDGTASAGKAFAQTGSVTWTPTNAAQARYINGLSLFWYSFYFSAGQTTLYYVTTDAPITSIKNIWDGIEGFAANVLKYDGTTYKNYTGDVGDSSTSTYADLSSLQTTHALYLGFLDPQQGVDITMLSASENGTASTQLTVSFWNGNDWQAVSAQNDGTATSTTSLSKGGVVTWQAATAGTEFQRAISDEYPLYYYKLQWASALDADTKVAEIRGISSPPAMSTFKFSETFQNRLFLFNEKNGLKNAAIYSNMNGPDIFNGDDSGSITFGDKTEVTAAKSIYNVFTTTAIEQLIVTKKAETWRLSGNTPSTWELKRMSSNIGNVAPLSMVSCEVTDASTDVKRSVIIWVSDKGPVMSDGANIYPVYEDVKAYWDPNNALYIPTAMQSRSVAWYDPALQSYKLLVASGAGSTFLNTELEYSLRYKEWTKIYRENAAGANPLQSGWQVHDTSGLGYTYGGGKDGYVYRLENGNNWNSVANIAQFIQTKDLILDNQTPLGRLATVKYLRTAYKKKAAATGNLTVQHYGDRTLTVTSASTAQFAPGVITSVPSTFYNTMSVNLGPYLYHSFKFSQTTNAADGLELTGIGAYYQITDTIR